MIPFLHDLSTSKVLVEIMNQAIFLVSGLSIWIFKLNVKVYEIVQNKTHLVPLGSGDYELSIEPWKLLLW